MRQSYFEGSAYVPLLRRAYEGWHELAQESGRDLLRLCGGIYIGDPESPVFTGSLASARLHRLEHEVLDAAEIAARFPTTWQPPVPADHPALGRARYRPAVHGQADLSQQHRRPMQPQGVDPVRVTAQFRVFAIKLRGEVTIEEIAHLVGHGSTSVTERVCRKELRPVITRGARAINELFDGDAKR